MPTDHALLSMMDFIMPARPPILYHYTSMQGLLSIAEKGRIWATHIRYLNDSSEIVTMWKAVLRRLEQRRECAKSTDEAHSISEIIKATDDRRSLNEFVASFSEKGDDLSQWRAYCPAGAGFSIGFDSKALLSQWVADPDGGEPSFVGAQLFKVRYLDETKEESVSELDSAIDSLVQLSSKLEGPMGFTQPLSKQHLVVAWLSVIAPSYKHAAFRDESEWRMVLSKPHKQMPGQRFRTGKSSVVPYIEVELNRDTNFNLLDDYMIREVRVGPTPSADLSVGAIEGLFSSKGHPEVRVQKSAVPYRHW
jgi:hypothetical protein